MKSFEELMVDIKNPKEVGEACSDEEAEKRIEVFLNGYRASENCCRRLINDISFQLNNKFIKGCQVKELMQLYNQKICGFLDDLIY